MDQSTLECLLILCITLIFFENLQSVQNINSLYYLKPLQHFRFFKLLLWVSVIRGSEKDSIYYLIHSSYKLQKNFQYSPKKLNNGDSLFNAVYPSKKRLNSARLSSKTLKDESTGLFKARHIEEDGRISIPSAGREIAFEHNKSKNLIKERGFFVQVEHDKT